MKITSACLDKSKYIKLSDLEKMLNCSKHAIELLLADTHAHFPKYTQFTNKGHRYWLLEDVQKWLDTTENIDNIITSVLLNKDL